MLRGSTGRYHITNVGSETVRAFIPHQLPPEPPLELTAQRQQLLERATLALGRLDSITLLLPDPDSFCTLMCDAKLCFHRKSKAPSRHWRSSSFSS